jgi:hypothetical protein
MALYQISKNNPYQRTLRILSGGAIFSLLGILLFSLFEPAGLSDSIAHSIGWAAGVIIVISILGLTLLGVKDATWKLKRKLRFEVSDGKIIQSSDDTAVVEIPLNDIESLHEYLARLPAVTHRAAASALSSGRVLKAIAAPGAALPIALMTTSNNARLRGGRRTPPPMTTQS